ncbi:unnamed protein product [Linum trigynum]|uniref:Uncharacterized protein n=1 Tax=Linum trigynum TaxID=586398 RepID=A0AAV2E047_9ROSI
MIKLDNQNWKILAQQLWLVVSLDLAVGIDSLTVLHLLESHCFIPKFHTCAVVSGGTVSFFYNGNHQD